MGTIIRNVTLDTLSEQIRRSGIRPGQRFTVIIQQPREEMDELIDRVSERARVQGLTDEKLQRLLDDEK